MALRVSTVSSDVALNDLGIHLTHPTTNYDLTNLFSAAELQSSSDLTAAIQGGSLTADDGTFAIHPNDYDPYEVFNQQLGLNLDASFVGQNELTAGLKDTYIYPSVFPVSLNSTAAATRNVYSPSGRFGTWSVAAGDILVISGSSAADGTYTVESVTDAQNLIVVESIVDSTGGTIEIFHPVGGSRVGLDPSGLSWTSATNLQTALDDLDANIHAENHASRHITGGADEVDGDQLDIDWNPSNYTPTTSPTEVTSVDHLTAHLAGIDSALAGTIFGTEYTYTESLGVSSTTSTTPQQKLRLTTASVPAGDYLISWSAEILHNTTNPVSMRVQVDDTTTLVDSDVMQGDVDLWISQSGFAEVTLTAAAHNLDIDYSSGDAGKSVSIRNARIAIWRVS